VSGEDCATCEGTGRCWCGSWTVAELDAEFGDDGCPDCGGDGCCHDCGGSGEVE